MTGRKLTSEQTETLFDFCWYNGVPEYEIQAELVDHLASAIETQLEQQNELTFDEALGNAYISFGPSGFKEIAAAKRKVFRKNYNYLILKFVVGFFQLPRVILTLALSFALYVLIRFNGQNETIHLFRVAIIYSVSVMFVKYSDYRQLGINYPNGMSFLLINYFKKLRTMALLIPYGFFVAIFLFFKHFNAVNTPSIDFIWSFLTASLLITTYAFMFYVPKLIKQHFEEQFPQFAE